MTLIKDCRADMQTNLRCHLFRGISVLRSNILRSQYVPLKEDT